MCTSARRVFAHRVAPLRRGMHLAPWMRSSTATEEISMPAAKATIDPVKIRKWVEERGGRPAHVASTGRADEPGILRCDFPDYSGSQRLEALNWDAFFAAFEDHELAFLYQDEADSRFNKLVRRSRVEIPEAERESTVRGKGKGGKRVNAIRLLEG